MIDAASDPGAYADALRFPPFISDECDGTSFRNLPAMAFKRLLDAGERSGDAALFAPVLPCLHATPTNQEGQHDHEC